MQNHTEAEAVEASNQEDGTTSHEELVQVVEDETARDNILKALNTETARKARFKEKLEKAEAEKAELQAKWESLQQQQKPKEEIKVNPSEELVRDVQGLKLENQKRNFQHEHNLSPAETDRIYAFAQGLGKAPEEVLKDEFVNSGLEGMRQKAKQEAATPSPSVSTATAVGGKTWDKMDEKERRANFDKIRDNIRKTVN